MSTANLSLDDDQKEVRFYFQSEGSKNVYSVPVHMIGVSKLMSTIVFGANEGTIPNEHIEPTKPFVFKLHYHHDDNWKHEYTAEEIPDTDATENKNANKKFRAVLVNKQRPDNQAEIYKLETILCLDHKLKFIADYLNNWANQGIEKMKWAKEGPTEYVKWNEMIPEECDAKLIHSYLVSCANLKADDYKDVYTYVKAKTEEKEGNTKEYQCIKKYLEREMTRLNQLTQEQRSEMYVNFETFFANQAPEELVTPIHPDPQINVSQEMADKARKLYLARYNTLMIISDLMYTTQLYFGIECLEPLLLRAVSYILLRSSMPEITEVSGNPYFLNVYNAVIKVNYAEAGDDVHIIEEAKTAVKKIMEELKLPIPPEPKEPEIPAGLLKPTPEIPEGFKLVESTDNKDDDEDLAEEEEEEEEADDAGDNAGDNAVVLAPAPANANADANANAPMDYTD